MNIHYHDACSDGVYTIDGKELSSLTHQEKMNVWKRTVSHLRMNPDEDKLSELIDFLLNSYGEYILAEEPCEQCGYYKLDIDLDI